MDAFYAAVEVREDPTLAGKPVAVGGGGPRGVVMAASYEARRFGVHSAMPGVRARRLCPELIFVRPNFDLYKTESDAVLQILFSFTPIVEQISLDEAFLDVGGSVRLFGDPVVIGEKIRARVRADRALTCSVGVAPNKFLAKLASEHAKPDGLVHVPVAGVREFIEPLPPRALWGVGEQTAGALERLGVRTVGDITALPDGVLERAFGPGPAAHLLALAKGEDDRHVVPYEPAKQISAEQTFERDLDAPDHIKREMLRLADRVAQRLRSSATSARTVTIKVRFSDFKTITRTRTLSAPTDGAAKIYAAARDLYALLRLHRPRIRLLGIAASGLVSGAGPEQLKLGERPDRWGAADRAVDKLRERYGDDLVERAAVAEPRPRPVRKADREDDDE
jgi:DNA polymerase-4